MSQAQAAEQAKQVIADGGYGSDALRERPMKRASELIAPLRKNNRRRRDATGRKTRRSKRRWIVERTIAFPEMP